MAKICNIKSCDNPSRARGWCHKHYQAWYEHGDPLFKAVRGNPDAPVICLINGCDRKVFVKDKGWCQRHYSRWWKYSDPLKVAPERELPSLESKFWPNVEVNNGFFGCWEWTEHIDEKGYGRFSGGLKRKIYRPDEGLDTDKVHRIAYEWLVGPIPEGLTLDHLCRNKKCLNPFHLEPCTSRENSLRGDSLPAKNARKTHCKNNHEYNEENTGCHGEHRYCKICKNISNKKSREKLPNYSRPSLVKYSWKMPLDQKLKLLIDKEPIGKVLETLCWIWLGAINNNGYGYINGKSAHIMTYENKFGKVPDGLVLDHLCRVRECVNPDHLEPVTSGENVLRGKGAVAKYVNRTHFSCGHEISEKNTIVEKSGFRRCRECVNARGREYDKKKRMQIP